MGIQFDASGFRPERVPGLWDDLRTRYADVGFTTAVGELRTRATSNGTSIDVTASFTIAPGDRWHVTDDAGEVHIQQGQRCWIRGAHGHLEPVTRGSVFSAASKWRDVHPHPLLGSPGDWLFDNPHDFHTPAGPPTETTIAGRPAWDFLLQPPPNKPNPLNVTMDAETGACLRMRGHAHGDERLTEITHIEFNKAVDPHRFLPSDRVVEPDYQDQHIEQLEHQRDRYAGLRKAIDNAAEVLAVVQHSTDRPSAAHELAELLAVSNDVAVDVLRQPLHRFTSKERKQVNVQLARVVQALSSY
ncbi:hypothetical protein [Gordonia sp. KTR9]|uniref:hypothetical protein n=1 Tax=Gordonia sp. KTR9 TaxID=337191 RepID=UPI00027DD75D|nr:hypothetical protein [Gordonia sp. KTR9]AFR46747.1 hypothetical protein KTR9_0079 [Gordonia sp. KTR9]